MIQTTRIIAVSALLLWPMTVAAQELVHFPSFEDNGPGRSSTVLDGYLSRPAGEGQHPAVIFLHGCGGLLMGSMIGRLLMGARIEPEESDWAGELTRRGYAVLMVDSFTPRGRREMCAPSTFDPVLYRNRARDAYGALLFLQTQSFVRPDRIGIMGWSQGGGADRHAKLQPAGPTAAG
jgi:dienelactone hydrolase